MSRTPVLAWSSESTRPVTQIRVIQAQVESILFEPSLEPAEGNVTWHSRIFVEQSGFNVTRALCFVSEPDAGACVGAHPVWGWRFVYDCATFDSLSAPAPGGRDLHCWHLPAQTGWGLFVRSSPVNGAGRGACPFGGPLEIELHGYASEMSALTKPAYKLAF